MTKGYDDIIHLSRPVSKTRPRMANIDRAAQFSPFAALTGYGAAIQETGRRTDQRAELDESVKSILNDKLQILADRLQEQPEVAVTYFQPDGKKQGGAYLTVVGVVKKIDPLARVIVMKDGTKIPIDELFGIDGNLFQSLQDE